MEASFSSVLRSPVPAPPRIEGSAKQSTDAPMDQRSLPAMHSVRCLRVRPAILRTFFAMRLRHLRSLAVICASAGAAAAVITRAEAATDSQKAKRDGILRVN